VSSPTRVTPAVTPADPTADPALARRLARDPYLAPVVRRWGPAAAFEAGWFIDGDPPDGGAAPLDDVGWLCTPTARVRAGLATARSRGRLRATGTTPVVLLATGGFHPLHGGHRAMMAAARAALEARGTVVVGGYLSPGHDDYLRLKRGSGVTPAVARVAGLAAAVADSDWLEVDPWEALARRVAVNYTDVTARLEAYLRAHVDPRLEVRYVCGADNARFALAFTEAGGCVVVGRPGHEATAARWRHDPRVARSGRVVFVPGDRAEAASALPPPASAPAARHLRLRVEDDRAVRTLGLDPRAWAAFQRWLVDRLGREVAVRPVAVPPPGVAPAPGSISLDPYRPGTVDVACSRHFDLGGHRFLGHGPRPGHPPVGEQVGGIAPGPWTIVDDDTATGGTLAFVQGALPAGVAVVARAAPAAGGPDSEIADSRDLLLGTDDGGLVVALPDGSVGRAPYLLPYVDPSARIGVPPAAAPALSRDVWARAAALFAPTGRRVRDLPGPARETMRVAGHPADGALADVCAAHAATLAHVARLTR